MVVTWYWYCRSNTDYEENLDEDGLHYVHKNIDKNIHYYTVFTPCEFCFWLSLHSPLPHSVLTLTLMRKISPILDHLCCEGGGRGGRAGKHSNPSQYD